MTPLGGTSRTHYIGLAVATLAILAVASLAVSTQTTTDHRLLGPSVLTLGVGLVVVIRAIHRHAPGRLPPISMATIISVIRLVPLALLVGMLAIDALEADAWLPAGLFAIAAGLDAIDGAVARRLGTVTAHGAAVDRHIDALTVLVGSVIAVALDVAPTAFVAVGVAQYAFLGGIVARRRLGLEVSDLPESQLRRFLGGALLAAIWIALLPTVDPSIGHVLTASVGSAVLLNFGRDFLAVSGHPVGYVEVS
ncbi:MAG: CDP-alcohol phosphatidyltransferase family protein [Halobacteriota archaeon]